MSELDQTAWLALGIVAGLVLIAFLVHQIRSSLAILREAQQSQKAAGLSSNLELEDSLIVLARCILDDQIELSEACIRVKVLMDNLDPAWPQSQGLAIFSEMYDKLAHMPTHAARKATDKRFLFKLDKQRFDLERQHREAIREGAKTLLKQLEVPTRQLVS